LVFIDGNSLSKSVTCDGTPNPILVSFVLPPRLGFGPNNNNNNMIIMMIMMIMAIVIPGNIAKAIPTSDDENID